MPMPTWDDRRFPEGIRDPVGVWRLDPMRELRLFRLVQRTATMGAWNWPVGGDRLECSAETYAILGWRPDAPGPTVDKMIAAFRDSDGARIQAALTQAVQTGQDLSVYAAVARPNGALRQVHLMGEVETDENGRVTGIFGALRDIAHEVAVDERVDHAERRLFAAIDSLPDGFVLYDQADRLVMCNRRYRELYPHAAAMMEPGLTFEEVLRRGLAHGHYPDAIGREVDWMAERLEQHDRPLHIAEQAMPGDRWMRVIESRTPTGDHVGLRIEVTELKRQQRALEQERERAEAANRAKSSFLANMSHEIRTPMNGVIGMAQALAPLLPPGRSREMLAVIEESGEMLMSILNDILDFSKIEAGRMTVEQTRLSLDALLTRIEVCHTLGAADRGTILNVLIDPGLEVERLGDPVRVQQILHNLVSNAVKFTQNGRIDVTVSAESGDRVQFIVRDTGIGMTPEQASQVFTEFAQADSSITRKFGGTGLGLSIVKGLIQAMGGEVSMQSRFGIGTTFRVVLPLPVLARAARDGQTNEAREPIPPGLRILAAEDNRVNRLVLMSCLDALGAEVTMTETGPDCLAAFDRAPFDLALIDISMPGMDGAEVIAARRRIEAERGLPRIPAIAVTAHAMGYQIAAFLAAGFDSHLSKPLRRAELEARLSDAVHLARQNAAG